MKHAPLYRYVLRVRTGAAASPLLYLSFPSSISSLTVIALSPMIIDPYVLLFGRRLTANVTVETACDTQVCVCVCVCVCVFVRACARACVRACVAV